MKRLFVKTFFLLVIAALVATAVPAQDTNGDLIPAGIDVWKTVANGTAVDFSNNPIPAGTFCSGSAAFSGTIPMKGKMIKASPSLGTTDTIVERLEDAFVPVGGEDTVDIRIVALSMKSQSPYQACGVDWDVDVYLDPDDQDITSLTIRRTNAAGGTFDATLSVWASVRFISSLGTVIVNDHVSLQTTSASWASNPTGAVNVAGPIAIDTNCDGEFDTTVPGTSNFHPGYNGNTPVQVNHSGPHPTLPPKKCTAQAVGVGGLAGAARGVGWPTCSTGCV